jgi:hypothetical protein
MYAFCGNEAGQVRRVFALGRRERLEAEARVFPELITLVDFGRLAPSLLKSTASCLPSY